MASTLHRVQPDHPDNRWSEETSVRANSRPLDLDRKAHWPPRPSPRKRSRPLVRFLITFCIGVAAPLAWQSFGDEARQMVANSSPVLGWLAPGVAPVTQAPSDQLTATEPATPSPDLQQLKAMSLDLAAMRQSVDQLAAQHQQVTSDIATMQAAQQAILRKVSPPAPRQAAAPAHNAVQN